MLCINIKRKNKIFLPIVVINVVEKSLKSCVNYFIIAILGVLYSCSTQKDKFLNRSYTKLHQNSMGILMVKRAFKGGHF